MDKFFSAGGEMSTRQALSFCFYIRKESPPGPRVGAFLRYLITGTGGIPCWLSCWRDCQSRCVIRSAPVAVQVHKPVAIPAHPKSSEQAEGYHHLSLHFGFPRSTVEICAPSSPRRQPATGFPSFCSGIGRAQITHCMPVAFKSVLDWSRMLLKHP
jgi:hypothetical protein